LHSLFKSFIIDAYRNGGDRLEDNFGLFLHSLRKKAHLTQGELANLLHVSHQAVSSWERELSMPDISLILPLAKILNTTAERLLFMMTGEFNSKEIDAFLEKRKDRI